MGDISENTAARIFNLVNEIHTSMGRTEKSIETMGKTIDRIDHTVHGNGQPGLDEKVRDLERNQRLASSAAMKVVQWLMPILLTIMGAGAIVWIKDALGMAVNK